jgi:PAS domain S-box-containing protein
VELRGHHRFETEHQRVDGSTFPVGIDATAVFGPRGELLYFAVYVEDITDRVRARAAEALLATVVATTDDAIYAISPDGRLTAWNAAAERLFGFRAAEVLGQPVTPLLVPRDLRDQTLEVRARLLTGERIPAFDTVRLRKGGQPVQVSLTASPIVDAQGRVVGASAICRDISERLERERLREEWTAVVAHDLRQPIAVLAAATSLLPRLHAGELPPGEARAVEHLRSATQRLDRMTSDLLDASRIEARRLRLEVSELDPVKLVAEITERASAGLGERELRLNASPCPRIRADAARLEQALTNLISNAHKYGAPGTAIEVAVEPAGDEIRLRVTNEGPGLTAEELERLFRRFSRTARAERSHVPGLGLGLYIARGLVEAHGGRIWAESEEEGHTTFHVALPALSQPREPAPGPSP